MKRVATPGEPDVAIPVAVVPVHVDFALVTIAVDVDVACIECYLFHHPLKFP